MSFIAFLQKSNIGKISALLPNQKIRLFTSNELQATALLNSVQDDLGYELYQNYLDKKAWADIPFVEPEIMTYKKWCKSKKDGIYVEKSSPEVNKEFSVYLYSHDTWLPKELANRLPLKTAIDLAKNIAINKNTPYIPDWSPTTRTSSLKSEAWADVPKAPEAIIKKIENVINGLNHSIAMSPTYKDMLIKDQEDYEDILEHLDNNRIEEAKELWRDLETAARDYIFENTSPEEAQQIAHFFNVKLNNLPYRDSSLKLEAFSPDSLDQDGGMPFIYDPSDGTFDFVPSGNTHYEVYTKKEGPFNKRINDYDTLYHGRVSNSKNKVAFWHSLLTDHTLDIIKEILETLIEKGLLVEDSKIYFDNFDKGFPLQQIMNEDVTASLKFSNDTYFDSTPSQEVAPEDVNFSNPLSEEKLRRTNPKRYDTRRDWYNDPMNDQSQGVQNRADEVIASLHFNNICPQCEKTEKCKCASFIHKNLTLTHNICNVCKTSSLKSSNDEVIARLEEVEWEINKYIKASLFKTASIDNNTFTNKLKERYNLIEKIAWAITTSEIIDFREWDPEIDAIWIMGNPGGWTINQYSGVDRQGYKQKEQLSFEEAKTQGRELALAKEIPYVISAFEANEEKRLLKPLAWQNLPELKIVHYLDAGSDEDHNVIWIARDTGQAFKYSINWDDGETISHLGFYNDIQKAIEEGKQYALKYNATYVISLTEETSIKETTASLRLNAWQMERTYRVKLFNSKGDLQTIYDPIRAESAEDAIEKQKEIIRKNLEAGTLERVDKGLAFLHANEIREASENEQVVITYEGFPQDVKEFVEDYFKDIIEKYPDLKEHLKSVKIVKAERPEHYPETTGAEYDTGDNSISAYIDIEKIFGKLRQGLVHELTHAVQVFLDGREDGIPALPKELDDKYYSGDLQFYWQNPLEEHAYSVEKEFKKRYVHASLCLNWQDIPTWAEVPEGAKEPSYWINEDDMWEIFGKAIDVPGNVPRVQDATLIEQFRYEAGFAFNDSEFDKDIIDDVCESPQDLDTVEVWKAIGARVGVTLRYETVDDDDTLRLDWATPKFQEGDVITAEELASNLIPYTIWGEISTADYNKGMVGWYLWLCKDAFVESQDEKGIMFRSAGHRTTGSLENYVHTYPTRDNGAILSPSQQLVFVRYMDEDENEMRTSSLKLDWQQQKPSMPSSFPNTYNVVENIIEFLRKKPLNIHLTSKGYLLRYYASDVGVDNKNKLKQKFPNLKLKDFNSLYPITEILVPLLPGDKEGVEFSFNSKELAPATPYPIMNSASFALLTDIANTGERGAEFGRGTGISLRNLSGWMDKQYVTINGNRVFITERGSEYIEKARILEQKYKDAEKKRQQVHTQLSKYIYKEYISTLSLDEFFRKTKTAETYYLFLTDNVQDTIRNLIARYFNTSYHSLDSKLINPIEYQIIKKYFNDHISEITDKVRREFPSAAHYHLSDIGISFEASPSDRIYRGVDQDTETGRMKAPSRNASLKLGSSYEEYTDKNKTLFESRYDNYGDDGGKLFWSSSFGQRKRFEALLGFTQNPKDMIEKATILDVGAGYGDFISFIKEKFDTEKIKYTGTELVQQMIDVATEKHPNAQFELRDIVRQPYPDNSFDLVIGSGLFALNHPQWSEFVLQLVNSMYKVSRKVVAVNFLQNHETDDNFKYTTPKEVYGILSKITKDLKIERGYLPDDFTVYLYKDLNSLRLGWNIAADFKTGDEVIDGGNDKFRVNRVEPNGNIILEDLFPSGRVKDLYTISPEQVIEYGITKIQED